jgi:hypothetical protein
MTLAINTYDQGRFGHQTFCILSGIALAELLGENFLTPRYKGVASHWNQFIEWPGSAVEMISNLEYLNSPRNPWSNVLDKADIAHLVQVHLIRGGRGSASTLYATPFDVFSIEAIKLSRTLPAMFNEAFRCIRAGSQQTTTKHLSVGIHVRRGDFSPTGPGSNLYVHDYAYEAIIERLEVWADKLESVNIYSQGLEADFKMILQKAGKQIRPKLSLQIEKCNWVNETEVTHFKNLSRNDIIIGSGSSYSILAAMCSSGYSLIFQPSSNFFWESRLFFNNRSPATLVDLNELNNMKRELALRTIWESVDRLMNMSIQH